MKANSVCPQTLPASWETCMQVKKQQLEPDREKKDWFKVGKGVYHSFIIVTLLI